MLHLLCESAVTNNGPSAATGVVITDALPGAVTFVSASDGGTESTGMVTWPAVTLTDGQTVQRTVTVAAPSTGTLNNVAQATATTVDPDATNNDGSNGGAQVSTTVTEQADVEVTKAGPATVIGGAHYSYTMTVTNHGPSTATNVVITDALPGAVTYVSASDGGTESGGTVTWPAVTLTDGQFVTRTVTVTAPASGTLNNVAQATATTADPDATNNDGTNASAQVSTTVIAQADVEVTKTGPTTVTAGTNFTYTLTVTNDGPDTAMGVVITDALPGAVTFVSASDGGTESTGNVTWPTVSLTNGQSVQRTVTVTAPASGTLANVAQATAATADLDASNNDGSDASARVVTAVEDFSIAVSPTSASALRGADATYAVTASPAASSFGNPVSLSCTGLPTGATCAFGPADVTPGSSGATSTLTVSTTAPSTPTGLSIFMVVGTAGALSHDATVSIDVTKDFSLSVSPSSAVVTAGAGAAAFTVTVDDSGFFDQEITFACSGLPAGATCGFTPSTLTPNGSDTSVQLLVSVTAVAGATIPGGGGELPWWVWIGMILLGLPFGLARLRPWSGTEASRPRRRVRSLAVAMVLACLAFLGACSGDITGITEVTQTFTITGTSASATRSTTATITVRR